MGFSLIMHYINFSTQNTLHLLLPFFIPHCPCSFQKFFPLIPYDNNSRHGKTLEAFHIYVPFCFKPCLLLISYFFICEKNDAYEFQSSLSVSLVKTSISILNCWHGPISYTRWKPWKSNYDFSSTSWWKVWSLFTQRKIREYWVDLSTGKSTQLCFFNE